MIILAPYFHSLPRLKSLLLLLALLSLAGCATLNESECVNGDWRSIGFEDGARGATVSRIGHHRKACAEYAIKPDFDAYNRGHEQGLQSYCRPRNGYSTGRRGKTYHGVCPATLEPDFLMAYKAGHKIYTLEVKIRKLNRLIKKEQKQLKSMNRQLSSLEAELVSNGVGTQRRVELLSELRGLSKEQGKLENQIKHLTLDQAKLHGQVDSLKTESLY